MSKPTPAVVFINAFVEPEDKRWIIGDRDLTSYMERKMAFINKIEKENKKKNNDVNNNTYDLLTYMSRESAFISKAVNITDEKDYGNFNATIDKFSEDDCNDFRKHERQTKQNGSPKYYGWGSFDNNFLIENGLMDIYGHLDYKRLRSYIRKSMNALITTSKKLDNDNVYWAASVHLNTDNVHLHFSLLEYEMREDRRNTCHDKNLLELEAFDKFKTTMVNSIMKDNKMFKQLTSFQREYLLPSVKETFPKGTVDLLGELASKLPTDKQWQYNRPKMKKYQPLIDDCVMSLIKNNPTAFDNYNKYLIKLDEAVEKLKHIYGTGKEERRLYDKFKINHLNEFRQRSGNALLNFLKEDNCFYDNAVNQYLYSDINFDNIFIPEDDEFSNVLEMQSSFDEVYEDVFIDLKNDCGKKNKKAFSDGEYIDWLMNSPYKKSPISEYNVGKILYDKDIDKESGLNYLLSASGENVYACTKAAKIMLYDNDFLNTEKTIELLTYAVGHFENNTIAKSMLGNIYLTKESFKQERTGLLLLDEAAAEGDEFAQQILGKFYMQDGHKNLDKALSYLLPSAENGNAFSQYYIGKLYLSKEKREIIKAKQFLSLSVSSGNQYAEYTLGCIYLKEGNNRDALKYLKKSAEHSNKYAKSLYNMVSSGKYKMRNKRHTYLRPSLPMLRRFYDSINGHTRYLINQVQYEIEQKAEYDKLVEQQQIEYDIHRNY